MGFYHITIFWGTIIMLGHSVSMQVYEKTLNNELKEFCDIIPSDEIKKIAETHIKTDKEFNEALVFLKSDAWANIINDVQQNPEWAKLKKHLEHIGLNLDVMFQSFLNFLNVLRPIPNEKEVARSFRSFFDDVESILPIGKLLALLHEKKQKSTVFQEFYQQLSSHEVHKMFEKVRRQQEVKRLLNEMKEMGARVDDIIELFYGFMNWDSPQKVAKRELEEDNEILAQELEDFIELVPWDVLTNISNEHLANDKKFGEAVSYLQGPEFTDILKSIKARPEYIELKKYLTDSGLDIEKIFTFFHDLIINAKSTTNLVGNVSENGLKSYLDEIEAALPIAELFLLLENKMENSGDFNRFIKKLSNEKVKNMLENVINLPESIKLFETLQKLGVKLRQIFIIMYAFLGWGTPFHILKA